MLKVVVAYIDASKFEIVRQDLVEIGVTHLAAIAAGSATPEPFAESPYRGSPHMSNLTTKARLEFVVHSDHLEAVKAAIFRHAGEKTFMFWLAVEHAMPVDAANPLDTQFEPEPLV